MHVPTNPLGPDDGLFVTIDGREHLVVHDVDHLPPFLMSVVSASDVWLFASSRGGLTAGRRSPEGALFPYVTDDKLHTCHPHTGPSTTLRVHTRGSVVVWEPFRREEDDPRIRRSLYKTPLSERVVFEEVHGGLGLTFRARWESSERFGLVRTVTLESAASDGLELEVADGLLDLMPAGVPSSLQQSASCLVNAYTRADVDPATRLCVLALQATIVDQPIPAEALLATTVVGLGLDGADVLLTTDQLHRLRRGLPVSPEPRLLGRRASYLLHGRVVIEPGASVRWRQLADVRRDHAQVEALRHALAEPKALDAAVDADVRAGAAELERLVASADGLQATADRRATAHHGSNVLFNIMRGGTFASGHRLAWADFGTFLAERNTHVHARWAAALPAGESSVEGLIAWARAHGDLDLVRLAHEYLPLFFSRRHGDPSRPWNSFDIRLRDAHGARALSYEGNWRDIFQNWEALCASHPDFLEGVIATFLDASTIDGFNPYRLTRAGVDWEVPEEGNPWSTIGFWGDHQIVYLGRLLEALDRVRPGRLEAMLAERWFVFADVPYRLAGANAIAADPRHTLTFDVRAHEQAVTRAAKLGGDGRLRVDGSGELQRASLLEKLLIPVLAKLANLVGDGGVWMNTQRPEWNDANNALAGLGLSVVTLCQLRRHLALLGRVFARGGQTLAPVSAALEEWLQRTLSLLEAPQADSPESRRATLDALQAAFGHYRTRVFGGDGLDEVPLKASVAARLCASALAIIEPAIRANRRPDGLWHSYNLLRLGPSSVATEQLYEMLEGQVAILSAGVLTPEEALETAEALFRSRLYREDQRSFLLYPERTLPGFLEKNRVPPEGAQRPLIAALLDAGDRRLVTRDLNGVVHFAGHLQTVRDVEDALSALGRDARFATLATTDRAPVIALFEALFGFGSFTGRSGSMYGYEGLGCIYWHMVSKLLLALRETHAAAVSGGAPSATVDGLARAYHRVRDGLGFNKSPAEFGAFPSDPYSHTPRHAGAQQPGMTGSVKEEILARWGELGVEVREGRLCFEPRLLPSREFGGGNATLAWYDGAGVRRERAMGPGELGFTYCQVPVVYHLGDHADHAVLRASGEWVRSAGASLDASLSRAILGRTGDVLEVRVTIDSRSLHPQEKP